MGHCRHYTNKKTTPVITRERGLSSDGRAPNSSTPFMLGKAWTGLFFVLLMRKKGTGIGS
jgi:hypothetical protein